LTCPTLIKIPNIEFHYNPRIGIELLHPSEWRDTHEDGSSSSSQFCENGLINHLLLWLTVGWMAKFLLLAVHATSGQHPSIQPISGVYRRARSCRNVNLPEQLPPRSDENNNVCNIRPTFTYS